VTFLDVVKLATTILAALGGGGAIVFGMSGFLGKLWADRALEKQRHEYAQLTQQAQHQLDAALKRVQVELDTLGLIHNLRTKEEFNRLAELWKRIANVTHVLAATSNLAPSSEEIHLKFQAKLREEFRTSLSDALQFLFEVMVFIPEGIAKVAARTLTHAQYYSFMTDELDTVLDAEYKNRVTERASEGFYSGRNELEQLIRKHIRGESLGKTESSELSDPESGPNE
jgi:hypothetical protein